MAPRCNISPVYAVVITRSCSFFFPFHYRFPFSVYYFSLLLLPPALLFFGADFCRSRFAVIPVYTRPVNMFNHGPSFIYSFSTWDLVSTNFLVTVASVVLVSHHSIHMLTFFVCTLLFLLTWPLVFFDALVSLLLRTSPILSWWFNPCGFDDERPNPVRWRSTHGDETGHVYHHYLRSRVSTTTHLPCAQPCVYITFVLLFVITLMNMDSYTQTKNKKTSISDPVFWLWSSLAGLCFQPSRGMPLRTRISLLHLVRFNPLSVVQKRWQNYTRMSRLQ